MKQEAIQITNEALSHLEKHLSRFPGAIAFSLSLKPDGCSGYQFDLKPVNAIADDVEEFENILHIPRSLMVPLYGLKISLEKQSNFGYKIKYDLEQASDYCGCGKSFKLDLKENIA